MQGANSGIGRKVSCADLSVKPDSEFDAPS